MAQQKSTQSSLPKGVPSKNASSDISFDRDSGYREDLAKGPMLRFEESLPKLPVPSLDETATRYLRSLRPLLSASEQATTTAAVHDFIAPHGAGRKLQDRLIARSEDTTNWLYKWWTETAYLAVRGPVVPYVSYFYSHIGPRCDPVKRAAAISTAVLAFKEQIDQGTLEPEYMKGMPMAMGSYQWMFNACRVPDKPVDHLTKYAFADNKHIIVMRKNQFFKVLHEVNGKQLNTAELEQQLRWIYEKARVGPAIGALTSENRDIWTESRALLKMQDANAKALEDIESASFLVCLDDAEPVTLEERAHQYLHGDGANRWFDKPLQFIINDNGTSGFTGEHSMMDGTTTHRLNDYVCGAISAKKKAQKPAHSVRFQLQEPQLIEFRVNDEVQAEIKRAQQDFRETIDAHELSVQAYQGYGKGLIKKLGCSPDAYVQMIIQLADYKMYGRSRPTYESVMTRRFQQGRTEAGRTVSQDSAVFCRAMTDDSVDSKEVAALFRKALKTHVEYVTAALGGKGVDRHLFGLKKLLEPGEDVPAIFQDPAYSYSGTWHISTSQLSSEYLDGFGWSQVVDNGWGIAYMINEDRYEPFHAILVLCPFLICTCSISFNIVSKGLGSDRMSFYLNEAAGEIRDLLASNPEPAKAKL